MPVPVNEVYVYEVGAVREGREALVQMTYDEVNTYLDNNPDLQATSKTVRRGVQSIDILVKDTYTSAQKDRYYQYPNYESNIASVRLGFTYSFSHHRIIIISSNKD